MRFGLLRKTRKNQSSRFYTLNDFKPRNDLDIQKGYLKGRFGAIPFLAHLEDLKSLMKIAAMMLNLEDLLHRKVDMVEASRLLPFALDSVNNDKFLIYERKS